VVAVAPTTMHKPIRYPVAVLRDSGNAGTARDFVAFLASPPAKDILRKYRFIVP
jgi:molybdate transport system substrate-binding protein